MARLNLAVALVVLVWLVFPCSSFSASSEEKEVKRIATLKKELEREKRTLARLTEEKKFLEISGTNDSEALSELSDGIEVTSENIKFLEEELGSSEKNSSSIPRRRHSPPSADRNRGEEAEKKAAAAWWDVYARAYEKF